MNQMSQVELSDGENVNQMNQVELTDGKNKTNQINKVETRMRNQIHHMHELTLAAEWKTPDTNDVRRLWMKMKQ